MHSQTVQFAETGAVTGTIWRIDPIQSAIRFSIRHMMFATVHGRFGGFRGTIRFENGHPQAVEAQLDAATIDTGIRKRDDHLCSADFLNVAIYPTISFRSTHIEPLKGFSTGHWVVVGDLTISGITRSVDLAVERTGDPAPLDAGVADFGATTTISRKDFGMEFNFPIEGGGFVISDEVRIAIRVRANALSR